ncbi:MAG: hypothetical protein JXA89_11820 [Anaerolineae bacterium]|nr:hypothetical protein [Anaerolineae bacterium]
MSPRNRANRAVLKAIQRLIEQGQPFATSDISESSTYTVPTVRRAIRSLEEAGYIAVDRSWWKKNRKQPYRYTVLREMENNHE